MTYRRLQVAVGLLLVCLMGLEVQAQEQGAPKPDANNPGTPTPDSPKTDSRKPDSPQPGAPKKTTHEQEAAIFERILNRARFENDGTGVEEAEAAILIQSQAGVKEFGQLVFGYSSATEKLEVEYVRVRKPDGKVVVTPDATALDFAPDVVKEAPMYSDYRQRHISVAGLRPGDTLEYRTVTRIVTPLAGANF